MVRVSHATNVTRDYYNYIPVGGSCPSIGGGEMQTVVVACILQEGSIIHEGRLGGLEVEGRPLTRSLFTVDPMPGFLAFS